MKLHPSVVSADWLKEIRASILEPVVLINGCFDILHAGHIYLFEKAASISKHVWVGINSDRAIKILKGDSRPIVDEYNRAYVLASLKPVEYVFTFDSTSFAEYITALRPTHLLKGGDYSLSRLRPEERDALKACSARLVTTDKTFHSRTFAARVNSMEMHDTKAQLEIQKNQ